MGQKWFWEIILLQQTEDCFVMGSLWTIEIIISNSIFSDTAYNENVFIYCH